jgi:hypothetical protein
MEFSDMGSAWVPARDAVGAGTLRPGDASAQEVAGRFDALVRYASLKLGRQLGIEVVPALNRRDAADPAARTQSLAAQLASDGTMSGGLKIPGAVGPLVVTADLRAGKIICQVDIDAPREGRPLTRVNWLTRQLRNAPENLRIEAFAMHSRGPGNAELLKVVRESPAKIIGEPAKELKAFRVAQLSVAGAKRGTGRGAFIDSFLAAIEDFYEQVLQNLKPWMPAPPRLRSLDETTVPEPVAASLVSTAISSQDGPEPGETSVEQGPREPADGEAVLTSVAVAESDREPLP